jgi:hypothetical protein
MELTLGHAGPPHEPPSLACENLPENLLAVKLTLFGRN